MISPYSIVVVSSHQISADLTGEVVMLDLNKGVYYGLDTVGARIWELIQTPQPVVAVRDAIVREYDVTLERCEHDLLALLSELAAVALIELRDAPAA